MHGNRKSHRFVSIPKEVNQGHVKELLMSGDKSLKTLVNTKACAHVISARSGLKGDRKCSELLSSFFLRLFLTRALIEYSHIKEGKVVQGCLMQRKCPTLIQIYSPVNQSDCRAIVILRGAHNHPMLVGTKLSRNGKDKYKEAARKAGLIGLTVLNLDKGMQTVPWMF